MEQKQFVWVVERIDWDQDTDLPLVYWEERKIMGAYSCIEDARAFVERNAVVSHIPYPLRWHGAGKVVYSGHQVSDHWDEGVRYELHYTALY